MSRIAVCPAVASHGSDCSDPLPFEPTIICGLEHLTAQRLTDAVPLTQSPRIGNRPPLDDTDVSGPGVLDFQELARGRVRSRPNAPSTACTTTRSPLSVAIRMWVGVRWRTDPLRVTQHPTSSPGLHSSGNQSSPTLVFRRFYPQLPRRSRCHHSSVV